MNMIIILSCNSIPAEQQRLRWGFPPKELRPSTDPTHPVELTNGERVSVDVMATATVSGDRGERAKEKEKTGAEGVSEKRKQEDDIENAQKGESFKFKFRILILKSSISSS